MCDDADSQIDLVVRGCDLEASTSIHRLLQALLELPVPHYYHHQLITDENGKRLAKRDNAHSLKQLRIEGLSVQDILQKLPPIAL